MIGKKTITRTIQILVALSIFFVLYKIGFDNFLKAFKTADIIWLIPVFLLVIPTQVLAAVNFMVLLKSIDIGIPFGRLLRAVTLSFAIGKFSPGRLGEFSFVLFIKNENIKYGEGLAVAVLDKLITFIIFSTLALLGALLLINIQIFIIILVFCILSIAILIYFMYTDKLRYFVRKYILKKYSIYFSGFSKTFKYILKRRKKYLFLNTIITLFKWIVSFYSHWFLFRAFGLNIPISFIILISSIVKILSLLPISFSGLGLRESSGTYLYAEIVNIAPAVALNVMLLETAKVYFVSVLFYLFNLDFLKNLNLENKELANPNIPNS